MPDRWKKPIICPIYIKVDKVTCANHRGDLFYQESLEQHWTSFLMDT